MQFSYSSPWWIAAFGLAIVAAITIFTYSRTDKPLSRRWRSTLIVLRTVSIGLILICLLEPVLIAREEVHRKANLLVLIDDSQSMSLADAGNSKLPPLEKGKLGEDESDSFSFLEVGDPTNVISRINSVKEAFTHRENSPMANLADRFNIQLYQFSSNCTRVDELNLTAEGTLTDIGEAISKAVGEWRGQLTAGIILVTDGGNNSGKSPVEIAQQIDMPIYTVGVGSTQMARDIQVAKVEVTPIAYANHLLPVRAIINSSGYDGREVQVSLMQGEGQTQGSPLLDSVFLTLDSQNGEQMVDLQLKPQQEGTFNFSVTVPVAPEELTDQNNVYPFFIKVVKTKLNVLYIDGRPRWEYAFLKRALQRDPNVESTCLAVAGADTRPQFPTTRRELFPYDVLILGDIKPSFFSSGQLSMIDDFVSDRGGSVIFLAGRHSLGSLGRADLEGFPGFGESVLQGMLPMEVGPGGARQVKGAFNPVLTQEGLRHPITRLSDDQVENAAIWRDLPVLTQFYAGTGIKLGATALAEHVGAGFRARPVIVSQRYGKGIVLMITSDSLWRWAFGAYAFGGDDSHYRRFWSGTIRWLASIRTEADRVNIETDKGSYHRDEKVRVTVYVYDESYAPVSDAQLKVEMQMPDPASDSFSFLEVGDPTFEKRRFSSDLKFTSNGSGRYSTEFIPARDGHYKINVEAHHAGGLLGRSSAEFTVQTTALEFQNPQLKEAYLKNLADISDGSYHHLRDISDLPSSIRELSDIHVSIRERGLWDNGIVLMIAVALLGAEWLLRKRKGLV